MTTHITPAEQAARDAWFAGKLAAPRDITLTISQPQAEMIAIALLEYVERRWDWPTDAQAYYHEQLAAMRELMGVGFPVTYNED